MIIRVLRQVPKKKCRFTWLECHGLITSMQVRLGSEAAAFGEGTAQMSEKALTSWFRGLGMEAGVDMRAAVDAGVSLLV